MSDLVEWLRKEPLDVAHLAADEIERLRAKMGRFRVFVERMANEPCLKGFVGSNVITNCGCLPCSARAALEIP